MAGLLEKSNKKQNVMALNVNGKIANSMPTL